MKRLLRWLFSYPPALIKRTCEEHNVVTRVGYSKPLGVRQIEIRPIETVHHYRHKRRFRKERQVKWSSWLLISTVTFTDGTDMDFKKEYLGVSLEDAMKQYHQDITHILTVYTSVTRLRYGKPKQQR